MEKSSSYKDVFAAECILLCKNIQSDDMNVKSQSNTTTQSKVSEWCLVPRGECCGVVVWREVMNGGAAGWRQETGECWYLGMGWDGMAARHGGCRGGGSTRNLPSTGHWRIM